MSNRSFFGLIVLALGLFIAANSVYIVSEYERGVVLRFGKLINPDVTPGLHFKFPLADKLRKFDGRILTTDARPESYYTIENKRLIVDSYAKWRIRDVETYYIATGGDEARAASRLASRIGDGLRNQVGGRTLHEVVSGKRDELMLELNQQINTEVNDALGVEVIDIRVKRIDLPDEVGRAVFDRMAANREEEARAYRAQGQEQAEIIRADADRQVAVLEANAYRDAEIIRGVGDATAAATFANAYEQDPDFYAFVRSLTAYKKSFANKGDLMVVDPESDFFRFLKDADGKK
ncbi:protease modulator HflC [Gilvimarinus agarilyticus]|uniref:protease modulator HflC n=1 Tax=unclassified Gilvimarinus TaxID=2642066 RepID=UPI001C09732D|nr:MULTISPECIES: protease modulator HflC [unclassified Gilvimarinus]MBU2886664.1 protease modulator HflC [Gilvimarinus agarilyticus]MDO6571332.1 protease modulator HflC [Gilvimarinus sp. 2_MG-2023]MDO6746251.1 protease modulator HflC [Gilvimarinus sp. 1_MG-2023]